MSSINLFNNDSLNVTIKTITDNNNVLWFRAKDIALFLGYKNTVDAIKDMLMISIKLNYAILDMVR
jgi:prophage antirepressor-like protein